MNMVVNVSKELIGVLIHFTIKSQLSIFTLRLLTISIGHLFQYLSYVMLNDCFVIKIHVIRFITQISLTKLSEVLFNTDARQKVNAV